jgi:hypothetical protein
MTGSAKQSRVRHAGMLRQYQTRNLEIPGLMLLHRPGMTDREIFSRHCERKRSNPAFRKASVDCFVAFAPRNDEFDPIGFRAIVLLADLPQWQIKFLHSAAANQPDGQITSDFQK